MKRILTTYLICFFSSLLLSQAGPEEALSNYFLAIKKRDTKLLKESIHAPDEYKEGFVKMIGLVERFTILENLIADKYKIPEKDRIRMSDYVSGLNKNLLKRKFKIEGNLAQSIPLNKGEIPAHFIRIDGKWLLDLQRGQPDTAMQEQAKLIDASYTKVIALLNGLILKIDDLNTTKFTYKQALDMVNIQVNRKFDEVIENLK